MNSIAQQWMAHLAACPGPIGMVMPPELARYQRLQSAQHVAVMVNSKRVATRTTNDTRRSASQPTRTASQVTDHAHGHDERSPDQLWQCAVHEAGHATALLALGRTPQSVSIHSCGRSDGNCTFSVADMSSFEQMIVLATGPAAMNKALRHLFTDSLHMTATDRRDFKTISGGNEHLEVQALASACAIIAGRWDDVSAIAAALMAHETLSGRQIARIAQGLAPN